MGTSLRKMYDAELMALDTMLARMGHAAGGAIESAMTALRTGDAEMARSVIARDSEIDAAEHEIEHRCLTLFLRQQPVAGDLRKVSTALKMVTDIERIADQASDIAEITLHLHAEGAAAVGVMDDLYKMGDVALNMVKTAIGAYVQVDLSTAAQVIARDDDCDAMFSKISREIAQYIAAHPDDAETAWSVGHEECYMDHLKADGMKGRRIGVLESLFGKEEINESTNKVVRNALKVFEENGATLVPVTDNIDQPWLTSEVSVHLDDFQHDLDGYLATLPADWKIHSMAEILEQGLFHPFSESNMRDAMTREVGSPRYLEKMYNKIGVRTHVLKIMADLNLDAMVYPHQQQLVCKIGANQQQRNGVLCSSTGFPSIAVPAGFAPDENAPIGVPVGMEIIGRPWSEAKLIEIAYAFEQHSHFRRPPVSAPDLNK